MGHDIMLLLVVKALTGTSLSMSAYPSQVLSFRSLWSTTMISQPSCMSLLSPAQLQLSLMLSLHIATTYNFLPLTLSLSQKPQSGIFQAISLCWAMAIRGGHCCQRPHWDKKLWSPDKRVPRTLATVVFSTISRTMSTSSTLAAPLGSNSCIPSDPAIKYRNWLRIWSRRSWSLLQFPELFLAGIFTFGWSRRNGRNRL